MREQFRLDFARLDDRYKSIRNPPAYPVSLTAELARLTDQVQSRLTESTEIERVAAENG